jgi:hypothetical protein
LNTLDLGHASKSDGGISYRRMNVVDDPATSL